MRELLPLAQRFRGMKPPKYNALFEGIANGIIGQQLSLDAAIAILNRFCIIDSHLLCRQLSEEST